MINQPDLNLSLKPKLIPSLLAGFEAVANHIELIILPIILDLLLWFGPHLRIKVLLQPVIEGLKLPGELQSGEFAQLFSPTKDIYYVLTDRFNIFSAIRTLPVGIPSLIANISPITNPLGSPIVLEARNYSSAFMIWLVVGLIGLIGSSYYYNSINRITSSIKLKFTGLNWMADIATLISDNYLCDFHRHNYFSNVNAGFIFNSDFTNSWADCIIRWWVDPDLGHYTNVIYTPSNIYAASICHESSAFKYPNGEVRFTIIRTILHHGDHHCSRPGPSLANTQREFMVFFDRNCRSCPGKHKPNSCNIYLLSGWYQVDSIRHN